MWGPVQLGVLGRLASPVMRMSQLGTRLWPGEARVRVMVVGTRLWAGEARVRVMVLGTRLWAGELRAQVMWLRQAYKNGLSGRRFATEIEMYQLGYYVRRGYLDWGNVSFYDAGGNKVTIPEPAVWPRKGDPG